MKFIIRPEKKKNYGYCYCSKDCNHTKRCDAYDPCPQNSPSCDTKCLFCGAVI